MISACISLPLSSYLSPSLTIHISPSLHIYIYLPPPPFSLALFLDFSLTLSPYLPPLSLFLSPLLSSPRPLLSLYIYLPPSHSISPSIFPISISLLYLSPQSNSLTLSSTHLLYRSPCPSSPPLSLSLSPPVSLCFYI